MDIQVLTMALSNAAALVPVESQGLPLHFSSTGDSLQAAQHLLLAWVLATASQWGLENADIPVLALADDEGCVARHRNPVGGASDGLTRNYGHSGSHLPILQGVLPLACIQQIINTWSCKSFPDRVHAWQVLSLQSALRKGCFQHQHTLDLSSDVTAQDQIT